MSNTKAKPIIFNGPMLRASHERLSTTTRRIKRFTCNTKLRCDSAIWHNGRIRPALSCYARSSGGIKYNRLIRLKRRIGGKIPDRW